MKKRTLWMVVSGFMVLSLVLAACGQPSAPATTTPTTSPPITTQPSTATPSTPVTPENPQLPPVKPSDDTPKYGGTLTTASALDVVNWDPARIITGWPFVNIYDMGWGGNWAKGPAGGHGTGESDWGFGDNDLFNLKDGRIYESWKWSLDASNTQGTLVYQIRKGIKYQTKNTPAGALVAGRTLNADDVVYVLKRAVTFGAGGFVWAANPELRTADISKTGPDEVTVKVPATALYNAITRFGGALYFYAPEVAEKYGNLQDWKNAVGTGPYVLQDYVPGAIIKSTRNPNYFLTNPVGPGKGDQLPYISNINVLVIPDASTRMAALRTGKLDFMYMVTRNDALQIKASTNKLMEKFDTSLNGRGTPLMMRTDRKPFDDLRVRQAMTMAIDFKGILNSLYGGTGQIITYPFSKVKGYEAAYVGLDDADFPADAKDLYSYNPAKAKQLLVDAGYPNGFKTSLMLTNTAQEEIDYYSIVKDMWSKIGIEVAFDLKDSASASAIRTARTHEALATWTTGPVAVFTVGNPVANPQAANLSMIDDPVVNAALVKLRLVALTDQTAAMKIWREEIAKRALSQAWAIPNVIGTYHNFWWPWVKNYSGELGIGYGQYGNWATFIWIDQALKKKMGY